MVAVVLVLAAACNSIGAAGSSAVAATPSLPFGTAIDAPPPPAATECNRLLRADLAAAMGIRRDFVVDGLAADRDTAMTVAADATATLDYLGVPITAEEQNDLVANGVARAGNLPLGEWVYSGRPDLFGGLWINPPGSNQYVVAVVGGPPAVEVAQCVAALQGDPVSFVAGSMSDRDGEALKDRISHDADQLQAEGIPITSIDFDETQGAVVIGVDKPTDEMIRRLRARYGQAILVVDQEPAVAL
jgi:hypothetical protein